MGGNGERDGLRTGRIGKSAAKRPGGRTFNDYRKHAERRKRVEYAGSPAEVGSPSLKRVKI
jgi:hypothetical protein